MITGQELTAALAAVSTGFPDRALNLIVTAPGLDDDARGEMWAAISETEDRSHQALALGDILRDRRADQFLVNECYRAAFYLGTDWADLAQNPLYAHFLANRAGAVLDKWVHYFPIYHRHLSAYRGRSLRVLEIGVYRGGGLELWQWYLGVDASIVGIDIDTQAAQSVKGRWPVLLGDQEDPSFLASVHDEHGPFDLIIDDGGHTMRQQIVSAEVLFPLLNDGGIYIVEDCHTSYWKEFGGGLRDEASFIEWAKARVDDMHSRHTAEIDRNSVWATHLNGLHAYDSVVVFDKKMRFRPFNEMTGSSSYLFADRFSEGVGVELLATRDAALHELASVQAQLRELQDQNPSGPAIGVMSDELRIAKAELSRAREQLAATAAELAEEHADLTRTRNQLLESWEQVRAMRSTIAWRATRPLRAIRRFGPP